MSKHKIYNMSWNDGCYKINQNICTRGTHNTGQLLRHIAYLRNTITEQDLNKIHWKNKLWQHSIFFLLCRYSKVSRYPVWVANVHGEWVRLWWCEINEVSCFFHNVLPHSKTIFRWFICCVCSNSTRLEYVFCSITAIQLRGEYPCRMFVSLSIDKSLGSR